MEEVYGKVIFFEHGRAGHCGITYGLDLRVCHHFHLHILPADIDISKTINQKHEQKNMKLYSQIIDMYNKFGNYLFFENTKGDKYFYPASDDSLPTHYLATVVSDYLNTPERANWQNYSNLVEMNITKQKLFSKLKNNRVL